MRTSATRILVGRGLSQFNGVDHHVVGMLLKMYVFIFVICLFFIPSYADVLHPLSSSYFFSFSSILLSFGFPSCVSSSYFSQASLLQQLSLALASTDSERETQSTSTMIMTPTTTTGRHSRSPIATTSSFVAFRVETPKLSCSKTDQSPTQKTTEGNDAQGNQSLLTEHSFIQKMTSC